MVAAFIVLLIVALGGGGYITYDIVCGTRKGVQKTIVGAKVVKDEQAAVITETPEQSEEQPVVEQRPEVEQKPKYIVIKYSRSFTAKLIQSSEEVKKYYSEIKNELMSYAKVKSRTGWRWEAYRVGNKTVAKISMRGKSLALSLALDPKEFEHTKYAVKDLSEVKAYANTPTMYKLKTDKRVNNAKELIRKLGLEKDASYETTDYVKEYPYEETEKLIERKLIKVLTDEDAKSGTTFKPSEVREKVTAKEVDSLMKDEVAASLIEKSEGKSDASKKGIINIDTLSEHFKSGETVTLDEIKKRIKGFNSKITYIKVLARGTLDKKLTVEADAFSPQAVKMIALTGGKALKK